MKLAGVALALALLGCPLQKRWIYTSTCGVKTDDCPDISAREARALAAFERNVPGWTRAKTCPVLRDWRLHVVADGGLEQLGIAGRTFLDYHSIQVSPLGDLAAFPHELAHVMEFSIDRLEPDYHHTTWAERGIFKAIDEANAMGLDAGAVSP